MTTVPFDTLKLATALRDQAHFSAEQSEGITRALGEAFEERVATREDISDLKRSVNEDISALKHGVDEEISALKQDIANVRQEVVSLRQDTFNEIGNVRKELVILEQHLAVKMGGMFVVATGVLAGLMKLVHG
jgi:uncharacterized protein involved in exopolysaccharide biosynthesis